MNIYLQLLLLSWVVVFVVDLSGFIASLSDWIGKPVRKPFSCSKCLTWWTGLILAAIEGYILDLRVWAFVAAMAFFTKAINNLAVQVLDLLTAIVDKIKLPKI